MASGLLTITSIAGSGPSYTLYVTTSTGVNAGDHVVAPLALDAARGGIYRVTGIPGGGSLTVSDDIEPGGGTYGAPAAGPGAFWTPSVKLGLSQKPNQCPFWGDIVDRDFRVVENSGRRRSEPLIYTDTGNAVIGPLDGIPVLLDEVDLNPIGGIIQEYTLDFTVRLVTGGSAAGYYVCVSPTSSAPGGGSFSGGSNPGTGIASILTSSDKVKVTYSA